jgi:hypothetical protein
LVFRPSFQAEDITQETMIGRRSPRRFNVLTKPTIVKALLTSGSRKPKYVGFRQNPVSAVHEAPASHCGRDDYTGTTAAVREQANDTKMKEHHLQGDECHPITENNETMLSTRIIPSKDKTSGDNSHYGLVVAYDLMSPEADATEKKEGAGSELGANTAVAQKSPPLLFHQSVVHQP